MFAYSSPTLMYSYPNETNHTLYFYNTKVYFSYIHLREFYTSLHNAIVNDLPMSAVQTEFPTFKKDHAVIEQYLNGDHVPESYDLYLNIVSHLEKNKFKMKLERKIEIFERWFYYLSIVNVFIHYNLYLHIRENDFKVKFIYFFKIQLQTARSICYELEDFGACFNYHEAKFKEKESKNSIYEDMMVQPDILTRAICSQSVENVKLLFEFGYKPNLNAVYEHSELRTALHWAYYCDNVDIFNYLIVKGFELDSSHLFYDPSHKKNFKFSLYLHFLREKTKINEAFVYDSLKFDESQCLIELKLYEHFDRAQIVEIFESMARLGFCFNVKSEVLNIYDTYVKGSSKDVAYSQLAFCVCQNGISSDLIDYFVGEFKRKNDHKTTQYELAKIVKYSSLYYHTHRCHRLDSSWIRLQSRDLIVILASLYPLLELNSLTQLNQSFFYEEYRRYFFYDLYCIFHYEKFVYETDSFRIFDFYINYGLMSADDCLEFLNRFVWGCYDEDFEKQMANSMQFMSYVLENEIVKPKDLLDFCELKVWNDASFREERVITDELSEANLHILRENLRLLIFNASKTRSLLCLSRGVIRGLFKSGRIGLSRLNLPFAILNYVGNTLK